eukprot:Blabericola_migrator_1__12524@NODE_793_length_6483_cov_21_480206_g331_i4_p5_GENE_NODE_793_length_6483_cov_21_480206_g331_i4NODE_793_length_6483_cov_21_480206_g331_i4_p5_ORF_typecomplete_len120_score13_65_NODE_793_length_6483_cov_21_480206_g331_i431223481
MEDWSPTLKPWRASPLEQIPPLHPRWMSTKLCRSGATPATRWRFRTWQGWADPVHGRLHVGESLIPVGMIEMTEAEKAANAIYDLTGSTGLNQEDRSRGIDVQNDKTLAARKGEAISEI